MIDTLILLLVWVFPVVVVGLLLWRAGATEKRPYCGTRSKTRTRPSESGHGSGRNITVLTTLKMAVVAPIPSARVRTAMVVKPGVLRSVRAA